MTRILRALLPGIAALAMAGGAWAQGYPGKPVRIIVPAGPGGPDVVGRIVAAKLAEQTGQNFFVENHPGANGIVGADMVAKAAPDGYTLMVYSSGLISNKSLYKKLPYDTDRDFAPISNLVDNGGLYITVNPALPAKTLKELIDLAKQPGSHLAYSTPGVGNTWHVATEVFNHYAGTHLTHVPYKGAAPALNDLLGGQVQFMFDPGPGLQHAATGKLVVLGVASGKRASRYPDIPTLAELGIPVDADTTFGVYAPAGVSPAIVERMNKEINRALASPTLVENMAKLGGDVLPLTIPEFVSRQAADRARYGAFIKEAGIKVD